jgi:hypothetical protein
VQSRHDADHRRGCSLGFRPGKHRLDDYFARHAVVNNQTGTGRTYVLRRAEGHDPALLTVLGFLTLSMTVAESQAVAPALGSRLPRYPLPVALIGRLAMGERARKRRLGEKLLIDALSRIVDVAAVIGCIGVIVDAKDAEAEQFYVKYDFAPIESGG